MSPQGRGGWSLGWVVVAATAALAAGPKGVVVQVKGMGGGPAAKTAAAVLLVDPGTTEIVAAARPADGRAVLHPPAGIYMTLGYVVRPSGRKTAIGAPFAFDGAASKVKLALARAAARETSAVGARAGGSPVATLGAVTLTIGTAVADLSGPLGRTVLAATGGRIRWIVSDGSFLAARQAALAQQSPVAGVSIVGAALSPDVRVEGELEVTGKRVRGTLHLIDPVTQLDLADGLVDEAFRGMEKLLRLIAEKIAAALVPVTATTTTTTTATTSTTDVAGSSTTTFSSTTSTTSGFTYCQTSADCGPYACCGQYVLADSNAPVGICCTWGKADCPPLANSPFAASSLVCNATDVFGPPPPQPLEPLCGSSTPAFCPDAALNAVSFACTTCADTGKYVGYLASGDQILQPYP